MANADARAVVAALGAAACVTLAAVSYTQGADEFRRLPSGQLAKSITHAPGDIGRLVYFAALGALIMCWLSIGRQVRQGHWTWRALRAVSWIWAAPFMLAAPLASRDLWAYAAQSAVLHNGLDPYRYGPSAAPGPYLAQVAVFYRGTPSPYGPLWLQAGSWIVQSSGDHILRGVLLFRLLAVLGFLLVTLTVPRLCRAGGGSPAGAAFLFCLNPLVLVIGLGGGHNDLLMVGLTAVGLWLAAGPGHPVVSLGLAAAVTTAAVAVKLPAIVALAFLPLVWSAHASAAQRYRRRLQTTVAAAIVVALVAAGVAAMITVSTGLSDGWVPKVNGAVAGASWLSVPVGMALLVNYQRGGRNGALTAITTHAETIAGRAALAVSAVVLAILWWTARRRPPLPWLALALLVALLFSTTILPWYVSWPLFVVGLTPVAHVPSAAIATVCTALTLAVQPDGVDVLDRSIMLPIVVVSAAAVYVVFCRGEEPWAWTGKRQTRSGRTPRPDVG